MRNAETEKRGLLKSIKELEYQNHEQGKMLDKVTNSEEHQIKIKYLMEDLRMWKDKNAKLELAFEKDKETRQNQMEKMKSLEEKNKQYQSQLQKLKEQKNQQNDKNTTSLPQIQTDEERVKMKEELEEQYQKQRAEMRKAENKTK